MDKKFTFVLKDKGTGNEGWWLKVSNADELADYYELERNYDNVIANCINGNEDDNRTRAIKMYSEKNSLSLLQGMVGFRQMVASNQLKSIHEDGCIYINKVGGYHGCYNDVEYATVIRNKLQFPKDGDLDIKPVEKTKDEEYGFLSPSGKFYEGKWGTHAELAIEIIEDNNWNNEVKRISGQNVAINFLLEKGFILIHDPSSKDYIVVNKDEATKEQKEFLYQYFINVGNAYVANQYKED